MPASRGQKNSQTETSKLKVVFCITRSEASSTKRSLHPLYSVHDAGVGVDDALWPTCRSGRIDHVCGIIPRYAGYSVRRRKMSSLRPRLIDDKYTLRHRGHTVSKVLLCQYHRRPGLGNHESESLGGILRVPEAGRRHRP